MVKPVFLENDEFSVPSSTSVEAEDDGVLKSSLKEIEVPY